MSLMNTVRQCLVYIFGVFGGTLFFFFSAVIKSWVGWILLVRIYQYCLCWKGCVLFYFICLNCQITYCFEMLKSCRWILVNLQVHFLKHKRQWNKTRKNKEKEWGNLSHAVTMKIAHIKVLYNHNHNKNLTHRLTISKLISDVWLALHSQLLVSGTFKKNQWHYCCSERTKTYVGIFSVVSELWGLLWGAKYCRVAICFQL